MGGLRVFTPDLFSQEEAWTVAEEGEVMDMDNAKLVTVIVTTLTRRGTGKTSDSPIRVVTQYWSLDGDLLSEVDPCPPETLVK